MSRFRWALLGAMLLGGQALGQPAPGQSSPPPVVDVPLPKVDFKAPVPARLPTAGQPAAPVPTPMPEIRKDPTPLPTLDGGSPSLAPNTPPSTAMPTASDSEFDSCGCGGCCNLSGNCRPPIAPQSSFSFADWRMPTLFGSGYETCKSCSSCENGVCGPNGRVWFEADALYWAVRGDFLPALVTTSPPGTPVAAAGVLPNAAVVLGNQYFNGDPRSGLRVNTGLWLNRSQTFGFQVGGLMLEDQASFASFTSTGNPIIARPFLNVPAGVEASQLIAFPGVVSGTVGVSEHNQFSGFDFAFRGNVCCGDTWRWDALLGFRHLRFAEQLIIQQRLVAGPNAPGTIGIPAGTVVSSYDRFDTGNYFNGLQAGFSGEWRLGERLSLSGTAKASFGVVDQGTGIDGVTRFTPPDTADRVGGLLALNSNIGAYRRSDASIVPELILNLGYQLNPNTRFRVGYDFLYLPNVQRPGQVIDLGIDPARIPPPLRPTVNRPFFSENGNPSDLLVQGVHFSLEFRY